MARPERRRSGSGAHAARERRSSRRNREAVARNAFCNGPPPAAVGDRPGRPRPWRRGCDCEHRTDAADVRPWTDNDNMVPDGRRNRCGWALNLVMPWRTRQRQPRGANTVMERIHPPRRHHRVLSARADGSRSRLRSGPEARPRPVAGDVGTDQGRQRSTSPGRASGPRHSGRGTQAYAGTMRASGWR